MSSNSTCAFREKHFEYNVLLSMLISTDVPHHLNHWYFTLLTSNVAELTAFEIASLVQGKFGRGMNLYWNREEKLSLEIKF